MSYLSKSLQIWPSNKEGREGERERGREGERERGGGGGGGEREYEHIWAQQTCSCQNHSVPQFDSKMINWSNFTLLYSQWDALNEFSQGCRMGHGVWFELQAA